jgi:hypothetical protein
MVDLIFNVILFKNKNLNYKHGFYLLALDHEMPTLNTNIKSINLYAESLKLHNSWFITYKGTNISFLL